MTGGSIDPFSTRNPVGIPAKMDIEALEKQSDVPTSNAMDRSEVSPMGAEVGTGVYAEGGRIGKFRPPLYSGSGVHPRKKLASAKKKREKQQGIKTDVSKSPKYKGAPLPPKTKKKKSNREKFLEKIGKSMGKLGWPKAKKGKK